MNTNKRKFKVTITRTYPDRMGDMVQLNVITYNQFHFTENVFMLFYGLCGEIYDALAVSTEPELQNLLHELRSSGKCYHFYKGPREDENEIERFLLRLFGDGLKIQIEEV